MYIRVVIYCRMARSEHGQKLVRSGTIQADSLEDQKKQGQLMYIHTYIHMYKYFNIYKYVYMYENLYVLSCTRTFIYFVHTYFTLCEKALLYSFSNEMIQCLKK